MDLGKDGEFELPEDIPDWTPRVITAMYDAWQHCHGMMPDEVRPKILGILTASFVSGKSAAEHPLALSICVVHVCDRIRELVDVAEDSVDCLVAVVATLMLTPSDAARELLAYHEEGHTDPAGIGVFDCYCRLKDLPPPEDGEGNDDDDFIPLEDETGDIFD